MEHLDLETGETTELIEEEEAETPEPVEEETNEVEEDYDDDKEPEAELEPWQQVEEEKEEKPESVPLSVFVKKKQALKAKLKEKELENETLRQQLQSKAPTPPQNNEPLVMPDMYSYDDMEKYHEDMAAYNSNLIKRQLAEVEQQKQAQNEQLAQQQRLISARDSHIERAEELISKHSISPELFLDADEAFKTSLDELMPGQGEMIANAMIDTMGEGSEKVVFHLGRNPGKMHELKSLMVSDKTGLKVANFLGKLQTELTKPAKQVSRAPSPAKRVKGDSVAAGKENTFLKRYRKAEKKGSS